MLPIAAALPLAPYRLRDSGHQMSSYAWSAAQIVATHTGATMAETVSATGTSAAQAITATNRLPPTWCETRARTPTWPSRYKAGPPAASLTAYARGVGDPLRTFETPDGRTLAFAVWRTHSPAAN
jgi:hypothetical protein